ncbi:hypothetical protein MRX96_026843 [Rhipicephalus microplus]
MTMEVTVNGRDADQEELESSDWVTKMSKRVAELQESQQRERDGATRAASTSSGCGKEGRTIPAGFNGDKHGQQIGELRRPNQILARKIQELEAKQVGSSVPVQEAEAEDGDDGSSVTSRLTSVSRQNADTVVGPASITGSIGRIESLEHKTEQLEASVAALPTQIMSAVRESFQDMFTAALTQALPEIVAQVSNSVLKAMQPWVITQIKNITQSDSPQVKRKPASRQAAEEGFSGPAPAFSHNYHNNMANGDERNAYNERLIDVIERERTLWDPRDQNYKSRAVTDAAWRHVATVMGSTVAGVTARWKNLRDTFRRVLKKRTRAVKSGAPADDELDESTKWHFFSRLLFLKETMEGRP